MKIIKESINSKSNKLILDESLFKPLMEDLSYYQDKVSDLLSSNLVDTVEATDFNGNEAFKLTANDGKVLYLVPSTLSQVDVYDNQGNVLDTNVFWRHIVDEFIQTEEAGFVYQLVGGDCAGTYTIDELKTLPCFDGKYSADQSDIRNNGGFTHRKELDNQPELNGYLGPMFNGWGKNHNVILRYETQEVYDALSESRLTEDEPGKIDDKAKVAKEKSDDQGRDSDEATEARFQQLVAKLDKIKDYTQFVKALKQLNGKQKALFIKEFGRTSDSIKPSVQSVGINTTQLFPTQSEIDWKKSLSRGLAQNCSNFFKSPVTLGMPVLTYNKKYILDGHHRWSQVAMFNPEGEVACINFSYPQGTVVDVLKDTQAATLATLGKVPEGSAGTNLFTVSEEELRSYISENISDDCWQSIVNAGKAKDKEGVINYIVGNAMKLNKPAAGAPDRTEMPQTTTNVINRFKQGITDMSKYSGRSEFTQKAQPKKAANESVEDEPYTKEQVEQDLRSITNNFTEKEGELKCGFEEEKDFGVEILKQHYKIVEVSGDDRREGAWYHISYAEPKNLKEAFSSNIDLDKVVIDVANLLDEKELGDNWIEVFPFHNVSPNKILLEITGADETARKAFIYSKPSDSTKVCFGFRNGSEGCFTSAEEIARFIAGEYGLTLNEGLLDVIGGAIGANIVNNLTEETEENDEAFKKEVIDWLSDHGQAWEDATDFFGSNDLLDIDLDAIISWISEHDLLCDDFIRRFDSDSLEESFDDNACLEKTGYHIYELKDKAVEVSGVDIEDGSFGVKDIICSGNTCKVIGSLVDDANYYAEYDVEFEIDKKMNTDEGLITGALIGGAATAVGNAIFDEGMNSNSINLGDTVRVRVAHNRIGIVTKLIGNDLVEVEFEAEGRYPARNDRYYISDVELLDNELTICPNCGGNRFNDNKGFCIDCGYDEKSYGDLDESKSIKETYGFLLTRRGQKAKSLLDDCWDDTGVITLRTYIKNLRNAISTQPYNYLTKNKINSMKNDLVNHELDLKWLEDYMKETDWESHRDEFVSIVSESIKESSYKKGDRVELDNGMTGTVTKDFDWENEDQVSVEIDGTGEMRYPRSELLKDLR